MSDTRAPALPQLSSSPAQEELLRRGLIRVSIAADGLSPLLDRRLKELRKALRSDASPHLLEELLPDLEHAVLAADNERQERISAISLSLKNLARQLQKQERSADALAALRQLIKRLDQPLTYLSGLPDLLDSLAAAHALGANDIPGQQNRGLWSKLFRSGENTQLPTDTAGTVSYAEAIPDPDSENAQPPDNSCVEPESAATTRESASAESQAPIGVLAGEEQQYSTVAAHVETVLIGLLDELEVLDTEQPRHERLRKQVHQGLNWYELAAVLDDISTLVLSAQRSRQSEFEHYLQQLNTRLAQFQGNLEQAQDCYAGSLDDGRALEGSIRDQVQTLHEDVRASADLNTLKATVEAKLELLLNSVDQARELREQREAEVASHLKTMVERIQVMEVEAQTFRRHLDEQTRRAMLDSLTGLANRAGLQKRMDEEFDRLKRYGGQLLLAVLDVDHFKSINDNFGHLAGDKVLRLIAQQLQRRLRKTDFIGRFGGEEFVLLMPGTSPQQGAVVLDELRSGISQCPFHFKSQRVPITISLGFTEIRPEDELDQAFDRADQAMYQAKASGRNRIIQAD
ncbi:GGDEF domain-containing protein [Pseudomonas sp.]|jgi:diguanylate cyclase|uniref:GGDEF domain-containing protein n=1 Tax=Pseudomonas sp. TaxID=306 RepID=UPI00272CECF1|nr:GGDEF domain-containing protein [Pseudomonas sp.]